MKYASITKTNRNKAIIEYCNAHPELSLDEIGKVFGVSKQRIHQIKSRGH